MAVFLIQVSGGESTHSETKASKWWQEPIEEGVYIHHYWKNRRETSLWEGIREGDKVLTYCTGSVEPYPFCISHVFAVEKVELGDENAVLHLGEKTELKRGMSLEVIREKVESGELSEKMKNCGIQGFNMGEVEDSDLDTILKWTESSREFIEEIEISRESDLHRYFRTSPEKIDEGLKIVESEDVLPEGAGIPDLVCRDRNGNYVVIEFKAGEASYDALGQLVSYKGAVKKKTLGVVRGIIIASRFDPKIQFGAEIVDSDGLQMATFKRYSLRFDLEDA